jgi:hypothetical protein
MISAGWRRRNHAGPTCEDCLALDIATPALKAIVHRNTPARGTLAWSWCGIDVATVAFAWRPATRRLDIACSIDGQTTSATLSMTMTTPNFGGARPWFRCPLSGRRARRLYLVDGRWADRRAHDLRYRSQRLSTPRRRFERALLAAYVLKGPA